MTNDNLLEATTITQFIEQLNSEYGLELPTELSKDHPILNLWQANVLCKGDSSPDDSAVKILWQYMQTYIAKNEIIFWARGSPIPFTPISNDLNSFLVFIVTKKS